MSNAPRPGKRPVPLIALILVAWLAHAGCGRGTGPPSKPELAILVTGSLEGTLDPCGCKDGLGGLARRLGLREQWREANPDVPILSLDSGRAFPMKTTESDIVVPAIREALDMLGTDVVNVGDDDMEAGLSPYLSMVRAGKFKTISANLVSIDGNRAIFPPYQVVTPTLNGVPGGPRVAVIGISAPARYEVLDGIKGDKLHWIEFEKALAEVLPKARAEADLVVVLANFGPGAGRLVANRYPDVDLVLATTKGDDVAGHYEYPPSDLIMTGTRGKYDVLLELRRDRKTSGWVVNPIITPLDERAPESDEGIRYVARIKSDLEENAIRRSKLMKKDPTRPDYLGSASCASCHAAEMAVWKETRHAHAWEPMVESRNTNNPLCLHCHSVGFMRPNGYVLASDNPILQGVGCESCHGPGSDHVASPGANPMGKVGVHTCMTCHPPGQTPDFEFETFWPKIRHGQP